MPILDAASVQMGESTATWEWESQANIPIPLIQTQPELIKSAPGQLQKVIQAQPTLTNGQLKNQS